MKPKALVLRTAGINCDQETVHALKISGADIELVHLSEILKNPQRIFKYKILVVPGGFSYGDDVAAGKILANELKFKLGDEIKQFVLEKRLVIGICNGFQVLVKLGLLPGSKENFFEQKATLTLNDSGRFQCEWVALEKESSRALWLNAMPKNFELPLAHGEGKFVAKSSRILSALEKKRQVVFRYYPANPNGSTHAIAGICNEFGNVVGLMPHPERFVTQTQHPAWTRNKKTNSTPGLIFWKSAVQYAKNKLK